MMQFFFSLQCQLFRNDKTSKEHIFHDFSQCGEHLNKLLDGDEMVVQAHKDVVLVDAILSGRDYNVVGVRDSVLVFVEWLEKYCALFGVLYLLKLLWQRLFLFCE